MCVCMCLGVRGNLRMSESSFVALLPYSLGQGLQIKPKTCHYG